MKQRFGFVSNSSSSSFIINLDAVTPDQLEKLVRYGTADANIVAKWKNNPAMKEEDIGGCGWFIAICGNHIRGTTYMSDYDLYAFTKHLGIPEKAMTFEFQHHRGIDSWAEYQTIDAFIANTQKYIGEWVAYNQHEEIIAHASTYVALREILQKEMEKEKKIFPEDSEEHPILLYITWIDPEYVIHYVD